MYFGHFMWLQVEDKVTITVTKERLELALQKMTISNEAMHESGQVFLV
jgi:hypothetical protein